MGNTTLITVDLGNTTLNTVNLGTTTINTVDLGRTSTGVGATVKTTTNTNTITSQNGIGKGAKFSLGAFMDLTEASHYGDVDATILNKVKPILLI